ncbi:23S rRNA (pseudouridine(1915)-N(3))-methyltransferase RlmH [Neolewinella antarctica]|uniref:Ribosomal RNA large subunit methyltransferase H n=1 Tax=Neolewinella antarctica TaxID=442734 RepID=A0ABX0X5W0_9BACT|nr:23S rRNA (pseudouridine(1915)-N(3))-methyltransferase RlmH [Neolewinella antarctica]NJC24594.1 23S rRNA (pseudouridine1915-N3)-methyltransferase [Neolewinella antarctica]
MKVLVYYVGKTSEKYLCEGEAIYQKRLGHYLPISFDILRDVRNAGKLSSEALKGKEGELILGKLNNDDGLILLDEGGKRFTSMKFARWLDRQLQMPYRRLIFVVGGAFGFSEAVYARANGKLSLSDMTFSHQMIRLFFTEQLYRSMTILRGEKYHNE